MTAYLDFQDLRESVASTAEYKRDSLFQSKDTGRKGRHDSPSSYKKTTKVTSFKLLDIETMLRA
jgi:hypothetical protein